MIYWLDSPGTGSCDNYLSNTIPCDALAGLWDIDHHGVSIYHHGVSVYHHGVSLWVQISAKRGRETWFWAHILAARILV